MSVNWDDIKVGDKIKVRNDGMVSEDWMVVTDIGKNGSLRFVDVDSWSFYSDSVEITDHQPAPRKVEVTLGTPLAARRPYSDRPCSLQVGLWDGDEQTIECAVVRPSEIGCWLTFDEARRLALDILATVGIED